MSVITNWIEYDITETPAPTGSVSDELNFMDFGNLNLTTEYATAGLIKVVGLKIQSENLNSVKMWLDNSNLIKYNGKITDWNSGTKTISLLVPANNIFINDYVYCFDDVNSTYKGRSLVTNTVNTSAGTWDFVIEDELSLATDDNVYLFDSVVYTDIYPYNEDENGLNYVFYETDVEATSTQIISGHILDIGVSDLSDISTIFSGLSATNPYIRSIHTGWIRIPESKQVEFFVKPETSVNYFFEFIINNYSFGNGIISWIDAMDNKAIYDGTANEYYYLGSLYLLENQWYDFKLKFAQNFPAEPFDNLQLYYRYYGSSDDIQSIPISWIFAIPNAKIARNNLYDTNNGYKIQYSLQNTDNSFGNFLDFPINYENAVQLGPIKINEIGVGYSKKIKFKLLKNGPGAINNAEYKNIRFLVEYKNQ